MIMDYKSPFLVFENFASPNLCEEAVDALNFTVPDVDASGKNVVTVKSSELVENILFERLHQTIPDIESHFGVKYKGTERFKFEWYATESSNAPQCSNSVYTKGKWLRVSPRDFTAVLFLSDYQQQSAFDAEFEVYGGKLEFPQHRFSFNPTRGTLVVFPSVPHFIHAVSKVYAGNLYLAKTHIVCQQPYTYDPGKFPGDFTKWF